MRQIDADRIEYEQNEDYKDDYTGKTYRYSYVRKENIDKMPIIEAELVKHGQWEWEPGYIGTQARCSVCKRSPRGFYSLSKLQIGRLPEYPFCPKCGARMDGDINE